ncbi:MAG: hypothetical protein LIP08_01680 [Bacteroides sp.]|nr:hypothetical protein [Bacteroides sp.]
MNGTYTSGWVQVRVVVSGSSEEVSDSPTITNTSTRATEVTVNRNPNYTGANTSKYDGLTNSNLAGHREVQCQYRRYINSTSGGTGSWETTWTNLGTVVDQLGYVTLESTGRVVAGQDYVDASGELGFDWATAMGISQTYNTEDYPQAGVLQNTTNNASWNSGMYQARIGVLAYSTTYSASNGGCAAYTESGTTQSFYLPRVDEIEEMGARFDELGEIAYKSPWVYWINEEFNNINASGSSEDVIKELRAVNYDLELKSFGSAKKINILSGDTENSNKYRVRCVRAR